jgi:hypothetical protein
MKRTEASYFLRGYIDAALFTTDPEPPSGCDYVESGRADELWPKLPQWWITEAEVDCAKFEKQNEALLSQAGDSCQNGSDFWYSRNGHGVGFWDRGYPDEIGDGLHEAAEAFGERYLLAEEFGLTTRD